MKSTIKSRYIAYNLYLLLFLNTIIFIYTVLTINPKISISQELPKNHSTTTDAPVLDYNTKELDDRHFVYSCNNLSFLMKNSFLDVHPWNGKRFYDIEYQEEYSKNDFIDDTPWNELLNFKDDSYRFLYEFNDDSPNEHEMYYKNTCAEIATIKIYFDTKKTYFCSNGDEYDAYFDDKPFTIEIDDKKYFRSFEVILQRMEISVPLIPEFPPFTVSSYNGFPKDHNFGKIDIQTTKGDFYIILRGDSFLLCSDSTEMQYPFYSKGIAFMISEILRDNSNKSIPKLILSKWSGENRMRKDDAVIDTYFNGKIYYHQ